MKIYRNRVFKAMLGLMLGCCVAAGGPVTSWAQTGDQLIDESLDLKGLSPRGAATPPQMGCDTIESNGGTSMGGGVTACALGAPNLPPGSINLPTSSPTISTGGGTWFDRLPPSTSPSMSDGIGK